MREILRAPEGWTWHSYLKLKMINGKYLYLTHQMRKNSLSQAQFFGCCYAQGHFHEDFGVHFSNSPLSLVWGMSVGCLIDDKALAFSYNKTNRERPILGCHIIINGNPIPIPMRIKKGKWIGTI